MLFDITPTRNFNLLYIILDSIFILFLLIMLVVKKRYFTTLFALFGGVLYFIVDFGYFYLLSHSRQIMIDDVIQNDLVTGLILFWMSMSYGITNFAFIWLCLRKDKHLEQNKGKEIFVKLFKKDELGNKEYTGILKDFNSEKI